MTAILLGLLLAGGAGPNPLAVWGREGHQIACEIAWQRMTPAAHAMVRALRLADPDSGATFPASCLWADRVRSSTHRYTNAYHYINIPAGAGKADPDRDCGDPARRCAPWAIRYYAGVLLDSTASILTRAQGLKFLAHFVGDLHQPLHAGRPQDLGGNTIKVEFLGRRLQNGDSLNLHWVWDSSILERLALVWPDSALALNAEISRSEAALWDDLDVLGWTNESYRLAEAIVYPLAEGNRIDPEYVERARPVVRLRLKQAGVRLASLLNRIAARTLDPAKLLP
ncbi:MAG: S1/P1 nuclease [Gemmatimonadales bacterium]